MDTIITAARVVTAGPGDGEPADPAGATSVLVRDRTIHTVGTPEEVRAAARSGAREIDRPGGTILPGLINTHVHLCGDLGRTPFATAHRGSDEAITAVMRANARSALRAGCTTVRDLGDSRGLAFALRDRIADGAEPGPRIVAAGTPLTVPGGHCWFLGGEVDGPAAITARIDRLADDGADLVKVMAGGGQMTPSGPSMWDSQFDVHELGLIVDHAARRGLRVAAHAHATPIIADCVRAAVATVEHCSWRAGPGQVDLRDETAAAMAARDVVAGDTTPPQWRAMAEWIPQPDGFAFGDQLPWMERHGVRAVIGTDSGLPNAVFDDLVTPLELYAEKGFGNARILGTATAVAADVLGVGDVTGRVAAGLDADLLVVDGDPRDDLQTLREPRMVMARGREADPAAA